MPRKSHIAIIGAGVSGLTVAHELTRAGCAVSIFEQHDTIGGLARPVSLGGRTLDRYYHFVCGGDQALKRMVAELGIEDALQWRPGHTSYYVDGELHPFTTPYDILSFSPISLLSRIRFGLHGTKARRFTKWREIEHLTAEEWLVSGMGREAYETVWLPLLRMKFGDHAGDVSAPWMWHRIHRYINSRRSILKPDDLGYLKGATQTLLVALLQKATEAGAELHLSTPVRSVRVADGRVCSVATDDGELACDAVVSTVPLPVLGMILQQEATDLRGRLERVPFLGVMCLLARFSAPATRSFWVNINDARTRVAGFVEYTNLNANSDPAESSVVYVPLYMPGDDPRFALSDGQFADEVVADLRELFPSLASADLVDTVVTRDAHAQAFCGPGFSEHVPGVAPGLPGLFLTDSTQLYPADRNVSGMIDLAREASRACLESVN